MANSLNNRQAATSPTFGEAARFWIKLGFISFGGPTGQIAIMQTELVDRRRWISANHFLQILNYCMLLPGPEAMQLATYVGWLLHRIPGGLMAGAFFVIPSIFIMLAITYIYAAYGSVPWIAALFYGLKPAVLAIVASATIRIGSRALRHPVKYVIAAASFVALFFFKAPFPLVIFAAAMTGLIGVRLFPEIGAVGAQPGEAASDCHSITRAYPAFPGPRPAGDRRLPGLLDHSPVGPGAAGGGRKTFSSRKGFFSARPPWSPSAGPMRCCPMWPSRRWTISTG